MPDVHMKPSVLWSAGSIPTDLAIRLSKDLNTAMDYAYHDSKSTLSTY